MDLLIGHALMRWKFVTQQQLDEGFALAHQTTLPLGKSLIALNALTETDLRTSVQVQSMLRDGILSVIEADRVMHLCRAKKVNLSQALLQTGLISLSGPRTRLGQLLVDCECLKQSELPRLLQICQKTGLPLGMVLLNCNAVDSRVLETVMRFQKLQRTTNNLIDPETLKTEVTKVRDRALNKKETDSRLGSLMLNGEIISKSELTTALDIASVNQKMLGELLVEFDWITKTTLEAALKLQQALRNGQTDLESAAQLLRSVHLTKCNLQEVINDRTPIYTRNLIFGKFLIISGFIDQDEMETARKNFISTTASANSEPAAVLEKMTYEDPYVVKDVICTAGIAVQSTVYAAMKYWQSAREGLIPLVKAIVLLGEHVLEEEQFMLSRLVSTSPTNLAQA